MLRFAHSGVPALARWFCQPSAVRLYVSLLQSASAGLHLLQFHEWLRHAGRFNERLVLSLASNPACILMDDELNILPTSSHVANIKPLPRDDNGADPASMRLCSSLWAGTAVPLH